MSSSTGVGDRWFVTRAALALLVANLRYWTTVAPVVRDELRRWEQRAQAIGDRELRTLALAKLDGESFHAEAAAMLATLAPRARRRDAVRAIVALELLYDYLDGLTERPSADPLRDGERLFEAYVEAVTIPAEEDSTQTGLVPDDDGYLEALAAAVSAALRRLPAAAAVARVAQASARRSAQAQVRMHAAPLLGTGQLEEWARGEAVAGELQWRELLAGAASSVLAVHALIVAAADPRTSEEEAGEIERAYLCTCVLLTLLDGLVDHEQDTRSEDGGPTQLGYIDLYVDRDELSRTLTDAAARAAAHTRALRNGAHHAMTLVGVVAYYTSAEGARGELAAPICSSVQRRLSPLIYPTLAIMRLWRLLRRARNRRSPASGRLASSLGQTERRGGWNEI